MVNGTGECMIASRSLSPPVELAANDVVVDVVLMELLPPPLLVVMLELV